MTSITTRDRDLHHDDGSHRSTPPTTSGDALETFERRLTDHLNRHWLDEIKRYDSQFDPEPTNHQPTESNDQP